jgi:hypothetical protein
MEKIGLHIFTGTAGLGNLSRRRLTVFLVAAADDHTGSPFFT